MNEGAIFAVAIIAVAAILISMVVFSPEPDPRVSAMADCTRGKVSEAHKLECAKAIFGEDK